MAQVKIEFVFWIDLNISLAQCYLMWSGHWIICFNLVSRACMSLHFHGRLDPNRVLFDHANWTPKYPFRPWTTQEFHTTINWCLLATEEITNQGGFRGFNRTARNAFHSRVQLTHVLFTHSPASFAAQLMLLFSPGKGFYWYHCPGHTRGLVWTVN